MNPIIESPVGFFTATILDWKKLLQPEKYKKIIVDSLAFLVKEQRVKVFALYIRAIFESLVIRPTMAERAQNRTPSYNPWS